MPLIQLHQPPGKTPDEKRRLVRELTDAYVRATGSSPRHVWIIISEIPRDSWSIGGETLADRAPDPTTERTDPDADVVIGNP